MAETHPHRHAAVPVHEGFIWAADCASHDAGPADIPGQCSLCGTHVWLEPRTALHRKLKPMIPVLCCRCSSVSVSFLEQAFPYWDSSGREVPDLAKISAYN